jgi:hypothetical protein
MTETMPALTSTCEACTLTLALACTVMPAASSLMLLPLLSCTSIDRDRQSVTEQPPGVSRRNLTRLGLRW